MRKPGDAAAWVSVRGGGAGTASPHFAIGLSRDTTGETDPTRRRNPFRASVAMTSFADRASGSPVIQMARFRRARTAPARKCCHGPERMRPIWLVATSCDSASIVHRRAVSMLRGATIRPLNKQLPASPRSSVRVRPGSKHPPWAAVPARVADASEESEDDKHDNQDQKPGCHSASTSFAM